MYPIYSVSETAGGTGDGGDVWSWGHGKDLAIEFVAVSVAVDQGSGVALATGSVQVGGRRVAFLARVVAAWTQALLVR